MELIQAPEPLSVDDALTHLRVDDPLFAQDAYIENLIQAAREYVEVFTGQVLIEQTWEEYFDSWPDEAFTLSNIPLNEASVYYTIVNATEDEFTDVIVDKTTGTLTLDGTWPVGNLIAENPIRIRYTVGRATPVPSSIKAAMLLMVGHLYANRESVVIGNASVVPQGVEALLWMNRISL